MTTIRVLAALAATLGAGVEPAPATQVRAGASAGTATDSDQRTRTMRLRIKIGDGLVTANLDDNATARDLAALLPLTVTLEDHAATEKIAYLPRKLSTAGAPAGSDPEAGDVAYYAPWATSPCSTGTSAIRPASSGWGGSKPVWTPCELQGS
jgi:hypothetical protein